MKRTKRRYTLEEYEYAMMLLKQGRSLRETSRLTGIPKSTLSYWKRNIHKPPLAWWRPEPSRELAYIVGVQLSDGYIHKKEKEWHYDDGLYSTDKEYVEEYSRCVAIVLGRRENKIQFKERSDRREKGWYVEYGSVAFYYWYKQQNLETLKPYIEHCEECTRAFLRGFFDGDGSNSGKQVFAYNSNREILVYVKQLLEKLGVRTSKVSLNTKAGTEHRRKNGGVIKTRKDCFQLCVNRRDFLEKVGFSIARKNK